MADLSGPGKSTLIAEKSLFEFFVSYDLRRLDVTRLLCSFVSFGFDIDVVVLALSS
jgi:hypothetical protein